MAGVEDIQVSKDIVCILHLFMSFCLENPRTAVMRSEVFLCELTFLSYLVAVVLLLPLLRR